MSDFVENGQGLRELQLQEAAANILQTSLDSKPGDQHLIAFDISGREVTDSFLEAASSLDVRLTAVYVPLSTQETLKDLSTWSALDRLLSSSAGLITALSDSRASTGFRVALVTAARRKNLRIVHMPGVNDEEFLAFAYGIDFQPLHEMATRVANDLTNARDVKIYTTSYRTGTQHCLSLSLEGRSAEVDAGIAGPGKIINIPTGEAYIAPIEHSANGSLVIDGSFPDYNLPRAQEVVLAFEDGVLNIENSEFLAYGAGEFCKNTLLEVQSADPEGIRVGELGIGLNPVVDAVKGRTITDEKAFGTAHVALGSNLPFGGSNHAPYHLDLVFHPRSIVIDDVSLDIQWRSR